MEHKHEWEVYSTALVDAAIMVRCGCGALGCVPSGKFRQADWNEAFHAPSAPYPLRRGLVAKVAVGKERLMRNGAGRKVGECHCRCHMASGIAVSMRLVACDGEASSQSLFCLACGRPKGAEGQGGIRAGTPIPRSAVRWAGGAKRCGAVGAGRGRTPRTPAPSWRRGGARPAGTVRSAAAMAIRSSTARGGGATRGRASWRGCGPAAGSTA